MKQSFFSIARSKASVLATALCTAVLLLAIPQMPNAQAQLDVAAYQKVISLQVKNLEKDTYVTFPEGYIFDRYEMRPPYIFRYSDGIERQVYLYSVEQKADGAFVGLLAIYQNVQSQKRIQVLMPNENASKQVWNAYLDELKYRGEEENGLLSTLSFVFGKELAARLAKDNQSDEPKEEQSAYDFCFLAETQVLLPGGGTASIASLRPGDRVLAPAPGGGFIETDILAVEAHPVSAEPLVRLSATAFPAEANRQAANMQHPSTHLLTLTASHPVFIGGLEQLEKMQQAVFAPAGNLTTGQRVWAATPDEGLMPASLNLCEQAGLYTGQVFNLKTRAGTYIAEGIVVGDK